MIMFRATASHEVDRLTISRQLEPTIWELRGCELLVDAVCILFHDLLASIIVYHMYDYVYTESGVWTVLYTLHSTLYVLNLGPFLFSFFLFPFPSPPGLLEYD